MIGKTVLVTGANSGVGKVTARELARMGANVVMVARSRERGEKALAEVQKVSKNGNAKLMLSDLSSQQSIRALAAQFKAEHDRLDVLVNNAGAMFTNRSESVDGYEMTFALNHMGYFLLTDLLLDMLKASVPARIVNVASAAHSVGSVDFDDLQREKEYSGMQVYGQSKMMNILFTNELARRMQGSGVTANSLHPGFVRSNFGRKNNGIIGSLLMPIAQLFAINEDKGAETQIYLASSPEVAGVTGKYFDKGHPHETHPFAQDVTAQKKLWEVSETAVLSTT
ncbi:MAG: SDR family NAD(P)-dependent oxidoreductase [Chloroflexi bacterium]|nr:MAG: SDR family NAD(P)-dependent oxidoreductase [Chloroflexota bacterium]